MGGGQKVWYVPRIPRKPNIFGGISRDFAEIYRPEIQTESCCFSRENDLNSEKGGLYESPPDRYVTSSSPTDKFLVLPDVSDVLKVIVSSRGKGPTEPETPKITKKQRKNN